MDRIVGLQLAVVVLLAGCTGQGSPEAADPRGASSAEEGDLAWFNETFPLQVGPPGDDALPGIVFGYDECAFFAIREPGRSFRILNGTATLVWDDSDGQEMNMTLQAERRRIREDTPPSPSPNSFDFGAIQVDFQQYLVIEARTVLRPGQVMKEATMQVSFWYEGDGDFLATSSNC